MEAKAYLRYVRISPREALRLASHKLPIKTKIVKREDLEAQEVGE